MSKMNGNEFLISIYSQTYCKKVKKMYQLQIAKHLL